MAGIEQTTQHDSTIASCWRLKLLQFDRCWLSICGCRDRNYRRSQHSQECKDPHRQCFVPSDLDLWPFDPKINGFPSLILEHFYVKFSDLSCVGFLDIVWKKRYPNVQTNTYKHRWTPYSRYRRRRIKGNNCTCIWKEQLLVDLRVTTAKKCHSI